MNPAGGECELVEARLAEVPDDYFAWLELARPSAMEFMERDAIDWALKYVSGIAISIKDSVQIGRASCRERV